MVLFHILPAIGFIALSFGVKGCPAADPGVRQTSIDNLLGFDESLKQLTLDDDAIIPEIRIMEDVDFSCNETITEASPYTVPEGELEKRFIVGPDDRRLWNKAQYPFNTVGKIRWSNGVFCSGALVGPRHVLTAKHCLVDGQTGTFAPGFDNGERAGKANIVRAVTTGDLPPFSACGTKGDWTVLIIDQRLGDRLGWFGAKYPDRKQFDQPKFSHIGYPGDKDNGNRPYRQTGTSVHSRRTFDCDSTGPFYTDTDCAGGQSGGPHWEIDAAGDRWIWGALSISVRSPSETYAGWASGNQMVNTIVRLRDEYP